MISGGVTPPVIQPPLYPNYKTGHVIDGSDEVVGEEHPDYQWNWGWEAPNNTVIEQQQQLINKQKKL